MYVSSVLTTKPSSLQVGDSLEEFLLASTNDAKLRQLMMSMSEAIRTIAFKVGKTPPHPSRKTASRKLHSAGMGQQLYWRGDHQGSYRFAVGVA